ASAPSAVCSIDTPSLALRTACDVPRIWEVIRSLMARPAASSFALLMRNPEDRRCKARDSSLPLRTRFLCAFSDETFALIDRAMSVQSFGLAPALQRARRNRGGFRSMGLTAAPSRSAGGHEAQDV